jgi:hypothetical protein
VDVVSFDNQLVHEAYIYYVTANSGQGITGRAVTDQNAAVINDGASSARVTANIPLRDTPVTQLVLDTVNETLTLDKITAETVKSTWGEDELLLTWPHYNPVKEGGDVTQFYRAPLFGGTNTARIILSLGDADSYYYKPQEFSKPLTKYNLVKLDLDANDDFKVERDRADTTKATITWKSATTVPKNATYNLYRIEAQGITNSGDYKSSQVEVVGDWEPVEFPRYDGQ